MHIEDLHDSRIAAGVLHRDLAVVDHLSCNRLYGIPQLVGHFITGALLLRRGLIKLDARIGVYIVFLSSAPL